MKELIKTVKEVTLNEALLGSVDFNDWTYANPNNPMVIVSGYGSMKFDQLKRSIAQDLKKLASRPENFDVLQYEIGQRDTPSALQVKISAAQGVAAYMNGKEYKKLIKKGQ